MPLGRILLALVLCAAAAQGADLRTLKGESINGDLTSLSDKEAVMTKGTATTRVAVPQVLQIDLGPTVKIPPDQKYIDVELVDGCILHCSAMVLKGNQAELTLLLTGQKLTVPLTVVSNILKEANSEAFRKDWAERLAKKRRQDVMAVLTKEGVVNSLTGTLGDASEDSTKIAFTLASSGKRLEFALERMHGLIFQRTLDPMAAAPVFKLIDHYQDLILVTSVTSTDKALTVTTPCGVKIDFTTQQLARLDYSKGKLSYLSDMEPVHKVQTSNVESVVQLRKDRNLDGTGPIRLRGESFTKGLAMQAFTELEYDLKGEYREFKTTVGIDDAVGGVDGPVVLKIEADGDTLFTVTMSRKDKVRSQPVTLNIKDRQKLRITVSSGDLLDLGKHLDLADAKVSK